MSGHVTSLPKLSRTIKQILRPALLTTSDSGGSFILLVMNRLSNSDMYLQVKSQNFSAEKGNWGDIQTVQTPSFVRAMVPVPTAPVVLGYSVGPRILKVLWRTHRNSPLRI